MGLQIKVINASTSRDIDTAFATFGRERPDVLFVTGGPFLLSRRMQLALLAARHAIPTSYGSREYAEMGGLITYGASLTDAHRQAGAYAGRILKGAKPSDLPVMQSTKFELVINHYGMACRNEYSITANVALKSYFDSSCFVQRRC